jgi:pre-mRNA-splicing factor SYF2
MPPAKKRKTKATTEPTEDIIPASEAPSEQSSGVSFLEKEVKQDAIDSSISASLATSDAITKAKDRMERFKALQARAKTGAQKNLKEATLESHRLATDPNLLTSLNRKSAVASQREKISSGRGRGTGQSMRANDGIND